MLLPSSPRCFLPSCRDLLGTQRRAGAGQANTAAFVLAGRELLPVLGALGRYCFLLAPRRQGKDTKNAVTSRLDFLAASSATNRVAELPPSSGIKIPC